MFGPNLSGGPAKARGFVLIVVQHAQKSLFILRVLQRIELVNQRGPPPTARNARTSGAARSTAFEAHVGVDHAILSPSKIPSAAVPNRDIQWQSRTSQSPRKCRSTIESARRLASGQRGHGVCPGCRPAPSRRRGHLGTNRDKHVTPPSALANSDSSTGSASKPRSVSNSAVAGARHRS